MNSELTREWREWHNRSVYETGRPPPWCSVCRGDLGDGGPGGGLVDEVLAGARGGDQGGGADVVDGAGLAAGGLVDLRDRVVGEQLGGAAGLLQVMADVAGGLVGGHALHLVADGDPLLESC